MVVPTNLNPLLIKSLLMASDSGVLEGISVIFFQLFRTGLPFTNCHMYLSKLPNSFCTFRNALALVTAALILILFLMISELVSNRATAFSEYLEIFRASKLSKALL